MYSTKRPTGSMHVYQVPIYILYIYLPKFQCTMWAKKGTTHENDKDKHQKKERPGETHETAKGTKGHPLVLWWANMSTPNGTNSPIEQHDSVSHPSVRTSCTSSVDVATQTWARDGAVLGSPVVWGKVSLFEKHPSMALGAYPYQSWRKNNLLAMFLHDQSDLLNPRVIYSPVLENTITFPSLTN